MCWDRGGCWEDGRHRVEGLPGVSGKGKYTNRVSLDESPKKSFTGELGELQRCHLPDL